jgi:hypothetical protein
MGQLEIRKLFSPEAPIINDKKPHHGILMFRLEQLDQIWLPGQSGA